MAAVVGLLVVAAAAIPVVAFGVVPLFVRSTLHEAPVVAPAATAGPPGAATPAPTWSGELRRLDPVHFGSGRVIIAGSAGAQVLRFEEVDIAGAPNMVVYLSDRADGQPGRFTDLGPLKATNGSFNYALPPGLDLTAVHSVVVWCRQFTLTVTYATLSQTPS